MRFFLWWKHNRLPCETADMHHFLYQPVNHMLLCVGVEKAEVQCAEAASRKSDRLRQPPGPLILPIFSMTASSQLCLSHSPESQKVPIKNLQLSHFRDPHDEQCFSGFGRSANMSLWSLPKDEFEGNYRKLKCLKGIIKKFPFCRLALDHKQKPTMIGHERMNNIFWEGFIHLHISSCQYK